jgi:D-lactate dehydrogenase
MAKRVLPLRPSWPKLTRHLVLHPTCSSMKDGSVGDLVAVARAFATEVSVPIAAGCCGFAGDKGFRVPELTQSATREEAAEVRDLIRTQAERGNSIFGYSTCQTCALGMSRSTGVAYRSIAQLCWEALQSGVPDGPPVG